MTRRILAPGHVARVGSLLGDAPLRARCRACGARSEWRPTTLRGASSRAMWWDGFVAHHEGCGRRAP